jgi:hypothetical protein
VNCSITVQLYTALTLQTPEKPGGGLKLIVVVVVHALDIPTAAAKGWVLYVMGTCAVLSPPDGAGTTAETVFVSDVGRGGQPGE